MKSYIIFAMIVAVTAISYYGSDWAFKANHLPEFQEAVKWESVLYNLANEKTARENLSGISTPRIKFSYPIQNAEVTDALRLIYQERPEELEAINLAIASVKSRLAELKSTPQYSTGLKGDSWIFLFGLATIIGVMIITLSVGSAISDFCHHLKDKATL